MTRAEWRATALVAATYAYFLLFAEFALIELARPVTGDGPALRLVMGALGLGGVAGSSLGASTFAPGDRGRRLSRWLAGCAAAAGATLWAPVSGVAGLAAAAAAVGLALGGATVCLAAGLRAMASSARLGWVAGMGTGAAYALCNVPGIFDASPAIQTILAAAAVSAGALLAGRGSASDEETRMINVAQTTDRRKGGGLAPAGTSGAWAAWVVVFLALVWMDSAAFYIIQHTAALKAETWRGAWTLGGNAAMHLGAALLAGWALDRGRAGAVTASAAGALALACAWLAGGGTGAEVLYVAGVSFYSVALVEVPARAARPWRTAGLFAIAGWGGSAFGIGMAQDLHAIPAWFGPVALGVVVVGLVGRGWLSRGPVLGLVAAASLGLGAGVNETWAADGPVDTKDTADGEVVLRGREVYIAEGCIHCHSQFVRPGTEDVVRWGPGRSLEALFAEKPPLPGNRRQGPDLANIGNRRTPEWNRLHLQDPRAVSPGSRMPSYARLFVPEATRGEALVAYLASLGAGTERTRAELIAGWRPFVAQGRETDDAAGAGWFARLCVTCHGPGGRGDGEVARRLQGRPTDLTRSLLRDETELARLIKFGRPGTAMAGHEALPDAAVVSLARYVAALQGAADKR